DRNIVRDAELEQIAHDLARGAAALGRHHESRTICPDDADDGMRLAARPDIMAIESGTVLVLDDELPGELRIVAELRGRIGRQHRQRAAPARGGLEGNPGA